MSGSLKPFFIAIIVVLVVGMWFMVQHEELGNTGSILVGCMSFTAAMMLVVYHISKADLVSNNPQSNGKDKNMIDRSQFKKFKEESLKSTCERISDTSEPVTNKLAAFQYLRETVHSDSMAAMEVVEFKVIQASLSLLRRGEIDVKTALALLELVNELLSNRNAKVKLIRDVAAVHQAVDSCLHWTVLLSSALLQSLLVPLSTLSLTGVLLCDGVDVNSITATNAIAFAAGESLSARYESLISLTNKSVVCVGLLCSDECPDAQTRLNDRGGIPVLLGLLKSAIIMCSSSTESNGIGAKGSDSSNAKSCSSFGAPMEKSVLKKHSAVMCKWICWCLFNLTLEHPPAKAVLYHSQGMTSIVDALKLHINSAQVHRQGLAVLFNLIAPDMYGKYSLAHARQTLMATGIVDVIEHAKVHFKNEKDIVTTCRAISNSLMVDFS